MCIYIITEEQIPKRNWIVAKNTLRLMWVRNALVETTIVFLFLVYAMLFKSKTNQDTSETRA